MGDRLANKVVLITGSTRGIGRAIALRCAEEGARVVVTGRTQAAGDQVVEEIRSDGGEAVFARADVTVEDDVIAAVQLAVQPWGRLDGLVCNAADVQTRDAAITELDLDRWNAIITGNLTSTYLSLKHGLRAMVDGAGGSVVLISSQSALRGIDCQDAYTAAKGGVLALTYSVASYYARYDVRCNCLAVGFVDSGTSKLERFMASREFVDRMWNHHLGKLGAPDEVAQVVVHLLADESSYVNGAVIPVDGGAIASSHMWPGSPDLPDRPRRREHR